MKKLLAKIIVCVALTLVISGTARSQDSCYTSKRHEIRIGGFDLTGRSFYDELNEIYYYEDFYDYYYYPLYSNLSGKGYGIGYRYNLRKSAFRLSFNMNYNSGTHDYGASSSDDKNFKYSSSMMQGKLGYERHVDVSKSQFYFGIDVLFRTSSNKYSFMDDYPYDPVDISSENNSTSIGGSGFAGAKYFLTKMLSLSVETSVDAVQKQNEYSRKENGIPDPEYPAKDKNFEVKFVPVAIFSVNIHL